MKRAFQMIAGVLGVMALYAANAHAAAGEAEKPLGGGKFQKGLRIEVMNLKRTSDRFLRVDFRISNPTEDSVTYTIGAYFWGETYYIEQGGRYKFMVAKDSSGNFVAASLPMTLTLGGHEQADYWVKFGTPHAGIKSISFYFPKAEPIEDVALPPAPKPEEASADPAEKGEAESALGSGKFQKGLAIEVTGIKPTSDNMLRVDFRIVNPTEDGVTYTIGAFFWGETYYIEEGGRFKYSVVKDTGGNRVASALPMTITLQPGEKSDQWAKFGRPHAGVKHVSIYFPKAQPIEDLEVPNR